MAKLTKATTEWFDQTYTAKEVYGRLWKRTRPYRGMIYAGLVMGILVGGAWLPILSVVQPIIAELQVAKEEPTLDAPKQIEVTTITQALPAPTTAVVATTPQDKVSEKLAKDTAKTEAQIAKAEAFINRMGITTRNAQGEWSGFFILLLAILLPAAIAIKVAATYLNHYFLAKAGSWVVCDLRNEVFAHLQDQSLAFHSRADVGRLMSRVTGDTATIQHVIASTVSEMCRAPFEILVAIGFVIVFALQNDMMGLLSLALIGYPICMGPLIYIGRRVRKWSSRMMQSSAGVSANMHENLTCIRVIKAYHTEASEKKQFDEMSRQVVKTVLRTVRLTLAVTPITQGLAIILTGFFLGICFSQGKTLAEILPLIPPFIILYKPFKQLGKIQNALENGRAALQRIFSLVDVDMALSESANPVHKKTFDSDLTFKDVTFQYSPDGDKVVNESSFSIKRGQMFAVVGSTGSGKTTLANLLARFYDRTSGSITIDGTPIEEIAIEDLRELIGVVTQEALLFNNTIASNIAYGSPDATQAQIEEASKMANAHDFIMQNEQGYQRIAGEKGFTLSGGERQRVCIARAILKNPPILILDEATSALDTVTEQQVQQAITSLMANRTVFAIAHRLSTIKMADCILVLDKGVIKERGTHDELYAQGGLYHQLCDIQSQQK